MSPILLALRSISLNAEMSRDGGGGLELTVVRAHWAALTSTGTRARSARRKKALRRPSAASPRSRARISGRSSQTRGSPAGVLCSARPEFAPGIGIVLSARRVLGRELVAADEPPLGVGQDHRSRQLRSGEPPRTRERMLPLRLVRPRDLGLHRLAAPDVAADRRDAGDAARRVPDRRHGDLDIDGLAALGLAHGLRSARRARRGAGARGRPPPRRRARAGTGGAASSRSPRRRGSRTGAPPGSSSGWSRRGRCRSRRRREPAPQSRGRRLLGALPRLVEEFMRAALTRAWPSRSVVMAEASDNDAAMGYAPRSAPNRKRRPMTSGMRTT